MRGVKTTYKSKTAQVSLNRWFFPALPNKNGEVCIKIDFEIFLSAFWPKVMHGISTRIQPLFLNIKDSDNQYHNLRQIFGICYICTNSTILAFWRLTKINNMWYHFNTWVRTSQLSPNASLLSTITLGLSLTWICFEGKMHHISKLTFVDAISHWTTICWWRSKSRRVDWYIVSGVLKHNRGLRENDVMASTACVGNNVVTTTFHQNVRNFFCQTCFSSKLRKLKTILSYQRMLSKPWRHFLSSPYCV